MSNSLSAMRVAARCLLVAGAVTSFAPAARAGLRSTQNTSDETAQANEALNRAIAAKDAAAFRQAIQAGANTAGDGSSSHPPVILSAIDHGFAEGVAILLDTKAANSSLDARDANGWTYLQRAAARNQLEVVRLLLARGADPNLQDHDGHTALYNAAGKEPILALLKAKGAKDRTSLSDAAFYGDLPQVRAQVEKGANLEEKNSDGETPLYRATVQLKLDVISYLLGKKAAPMALDRSGHSAFEQIFARNAWYWDRQDTPWVEPKLVQAAQAYLQAGVDPNARFGRDRETPLMLAAEIGSKPLVKALIEGGADPRLTDAHHLTASQHVYSWRGSDAESLRKFLKARE